MTHLSAIFTTLTLSVAIIGWKPLSEHQVPRGTDISGQLRDVATS